METRRQKRRGEDAQGTPPTETPAKLLQPPRSVRSAAALSMEQEQEELQHAATAARELAVAVEPHRPSADAIFERMQTALARAASHGRNPKETGQVGVLKRKWQRFLSMFGERLQFDAKMCECSWRCPKEATEVSAVA